MAEEKPTRDADAIADTSLRFLEGWLIERKPDVAREYLSESPVMGACLGNLNESLAWRETRAGVLEKLTPAFIRLASDLPKNARLDDIIAGQEKKLDRVRVKHTNPSLFDLYPVGPDLRRVIERGICKGEDDSEFFKQGIRRPPEMYLMLFHFKAGLKVTLLWCREGMGLRILSIDFPD